MLNKSNIKNLQIIATKKRAEFQQNKKLFEKLDTEILEFELQRNRDAYLSAIERFNSLKDNARFQLGVVGLIGTVVMTILFSIVGVKHFFETTELNYVLFFWGVIFMCEVSWLLHIPFWTRRECNLFSMILRGMPENLKSFSPEGYDKRKVMINEICDYKYKSDISETLFQDDFDELAKNEILIFEFITGTITSIFFFFIFGLLPTTSEGDTGTFIQIIIILDIISIFFWQLYPVLTLIYGYIKRKIRNIINRIVRIHEKSHRE